MKKVTVRKKCTDCSYGEMKATGNASTNSAGTTYEHMCNNCNHRDYSLNEHYPHSYFEFEPEEEREEWK